MTNAFLVRTVTAGLATLIAVGSTPVIAAPAAVPSAYLGNSLVCKQAEGPRCQLWLDADGRYSVFYDLGLQPQAPVAGSQFQLEGRSGRYTVRGTGEHRQICLKPDAAAGARFGSAERDLPFARAACYALPDHQIGDRWQGGSAADRGYTYWLVAGR